MWKSLFNLKVKTPMLIKPTIIMFNVELRMVWVIFWTHTIHSLVKTRLIGLHSWSCHTKTAYPLKIVGFVIRKETELGFTYLIDGGREVDNYLWCRQFPFAHSTHIHTNKSSTTLIPFRSVIDRGAKGIGVVGILGATNQTTVSVVLQVLSTWQQQRSDPTSGLPLE